MNAKECLETRRSIRKYKSDAVSSDVLYEIVETAKYLGYENENLFVKFFKYHEGITPSQYVSMFYNTHINHK